MQCLDLSTLLQPIGAGFGPLDQGLGQHVRLVEFALAYVVFGDAVRQRPQGHDIKHADFAVDHIGVIQLFYKCAIVFCRRQRG